MDEDDSPFSIDFSDRCNARADTALFQDAVRHVLADAGRSSGRVSLVLVGDAQIAELNERFLKHAGPTDCLTFDYSGESEELDGEVVISWETANREAQSRHHDTQAEAILYAIHGTLHLLGMNDLESKDSDRMHAIEDRLLSELGLGPVYSK